MKSKIISVLKFVIGWPLSLIALFFLLKTFTPHLSQLQTTFLHSNLFLLVLGIISFLVYFIFRIILWQKILQYWGHFVPFKANAWYWSLAELNRYIPGNIWSILGRGNTFSRFGISQKKLLLGWVAESLLVVLGNLTVGLFGLTLLFFHMLPEFPLRQQLYVTTNISIILLDLLWVFNAKAKYISLLPKKINEIAFSPTQSFSLLFYATLCFFFFGLGSFFTIQSLFTLPHKQMLEFVGLFSAAFLLGYVSIITPMGLGVRELVMTGGLFGFIAQNALGIVPIFVRAISIVSELLFLGIAYMIYKVNLFKNNKIIRHIQKYGHEYLLGLGIALYIAYFTTACFLRYSNFFTGRFDLGNMDQTVWNTLHGRIFQLTDPNGTNIMSRLATHADFILVLLAPFYIIWQDPRMLLLIQTVVLALGAVFVFLIGKDIIKSKKIALAISFAYLLNPSIQNSNLYDFHAVTFATTFFLGAWYFLKKRKVFLSLFFLALAGLTKEDTWAVVGLFGIYIAFFEKKKLIGLITTLVSFLMFYLLIWKFIPSARGGQHFALEYYSDFGSTPTSVIKNILFSPLTILKLIFSKSRLLYLYEMASPLGFLPIAASLLIIFALPDLAINLLSNNTQMHEIYYQYTANISPFLFIATIYAISFIRKKMRFINESAIVWYVGIFAIIGAYFIGPLPGALHENIDMFTRQQPDRAVIEEFLNDIPKNLSVAATNNLGSHLSHRQLIYTVPVGINKADIIVFLLNDPYAQPSLKAQKEMVEIMKYDKRYHELFEKGDFVAFEKVHDPTIH